MEEQRVSSNKSSHGKWNFSSEVGFFRTIIFVVDGRTTTKLHHHAMLQCLIHIILINVLPFFGMEYNERSSGKTENRISNTTIEVSFSLSLSLSQKDWFIYWLLLLLLLLLLLQLQRIDHHHRPIVVVEEVDVDKDVDKDKEGIEILKHTHTHTYAHTCTQVANKNIKTTAYYERKDYNYSFISMMGINRGSFCMTPVTTV